MKMQYSRRRNAFLSGSSWPIAAVLGALVVLFFILRMVAPDVMAMLATPFWKSGEAISKSTAAVTLPFANTAKLREERDRLLAENAALVHQNAALTAQARDTQGLGAGIPAGVLVRPPVSPYDALVVGAGGAQGVRADAFVFAPGGVPVGVVETVSANTSRIILYSTPGRITEGWVGEARIPISLEGKGSGAFAATLPRESGIEPGAVVYLPGPGALPAGTVVRVDADPSSPRTTVHIQPMVNPFSLTWVTIAP